MNPQAAQNYLKTRVMTATPEQLQMMLFDGALRFGEQARLGLEKKDFEQSYNNISKIQKILAELSGSLKHDISPELCKRLQGLYNFAYRKLIEASVEHRIDSLNEAIKILKYQRETWMLLLAQLGQKKAAAAASSMEMPAPSSRMEASISMQG